VSPRLGSPDRLPSKPRPSNAGTNLEGANESLLYEARKVGRATQSSGRVPFLRTRREAEWAGPRIAWVTASVSVAMAATVRTGASGPVVDLALRRLGHPHFITTHAACCTAPHGVGADPKPASLTIGSCRKLATHASISRRLTPVALAPHRVDDEPEAAPVVEPRVERAECRRLRRELEEAEGGGEEGAAAVDRDGHRYSIT
jgi:hypothetical protein